MLKLKILQEVAKIPSATTKTSSSQINTFLKRKKENVGPYFYTCPFSSGNIHVTQYRPIKLITGELCWGNSRQDKIYVRKEVSGKTSSPPFLQVFLLRHDVWSLSSHFVVMRERVPREPQRSPDMGETLIFLEIILL